jgi:hypothetical protein
MHDVMSATGKGVEELSACHLRLRGVCVFVFFFLQYDSHVYGTCMAKDFKNLKITSTYIGESYNHCCMVDWLF